MQFVIEVYFEAGSSKWVAHAPFVDPSQKYPPKLVARDAIKASAIAACEALVATWVKNHPFSSMQKQPTAMNAEYLTRYATEAGIESPTLTVTTPYP